MKSCFLDAVVFRGCLHYNLVLHNYIKVMIFLMAWMQEERMETNNCNWNFFVAAPCMYTLHWWCDGRLEYFNTCPVLGRHQGWRTLSLLIKKYFLLFRLIIEDWCWYWWQNGHGEKNAEQKRVKKNLKQSRVPRQQRNNKKMIKIFTVNALRALPTFSIFFVVSSLLLFSFNLINYTFCCLKCS